MFVDFCLLYLCNNFWMLFFLFRRHRKKLWKTKWAFGLVGQKRKHARIKIRLVTLMSECRRLVYLFSSMNVVLKCPMYEVQSLVHFLLKSISLLLLLCGMDFFKHAATERLKPEVLVFKSSAVYYFWRCMLEYMKRQVTNLKSFFFPECVYISLCLSPQFAFCFFRTCYKLRSVHS